MEVPNLTKLNRKIRNNFTIVLLSLATIAFTIQCSSKTTTPTGDIYETSKQTNQMTLLGSIDKNKSAPNYYATSKTQLNFYLDTNETYQEIEGFGASFTESSAFNLAGISTKKRLEVLEKLFSPTKGAGFSLTRTHINSCDYSIGSYSYVADNDTNLSSFSVEEDTKGFHQEDYPIENYSRPQFYPDFSSIEDSTYDLIPMIKEALAIDGANFNILASPWSPPKWMKTLNSWNMGSLKAEYYAEWAKYFSKYIASYKQEGIDIWGLTPQNEPRHSGTWESCKWETDSLNNFIGNYLGPQLVKDGYINLGDLNAGLKLFCYDHNKHDILEEVVPIMQDPLSRKYLYGTAFHWYGILYPPNRPNYSGNQLDSLHNMFPTKKLLHSESSIDIDAANPIDQFWTTGDYDWTNNMMIPFVQYATDIITDLNNWSIGYIEWCMILSNEGKPNPWGNYNSAPILINPKTDEVIYTPIYYIISHFSKFIKPGATRVKTSSKQAEENILFTSFKNTDGSIAFVLFNNNKEAYSYNINVESDYYSGQIDAYALQTIYIH
jgi:glucosylceramidase